MNRSKHAVKMFLFDLSLSVNYCLQRTTKMLFLLWVFVNFREEMCCYHWVNRHMLGIIITTHFKCRETLNGIKDLNSHDVNWIL